MRAIGSGLVFHDTLYGAATSSALNGAPSSMNCTPASRFREEAVMFNVPVSVFPAVGDVIESATGPGVPLRPSDSPGRPGTPKCQQPDRADHPAWCNRRAGSEAGRPHSQPDGRDAGARHCRCLVGEGGRYGGDPGSRRGDAGVRELQHLDVQERVGAGEEVEGLCPGWIECATVTDPFGLSVTAYSTRLPENTAVSTSGRPLRMVSRWMLMFPG